MKLPIMITLVIALGFLSVTITEAKVYKWKDAEGVMHYSSVPPKPTEKVSDLKDDLRITDNKAVAHKSKAENNTDTEANKKKKNREKKRKKRNYCNGQRRNLELLKRNLNVKWIEKGKSTKLSAEQRKDKLRSLEDSISTNCSYGEEAEDRREHKRSNKPNGKPKQTNKPRD
ncbi:MAG TPA: DUF4124 domain-containing protein [Leucothrix mucor]|uniref:DUF4124 domain-containing protein n=1 Tax=Leucothrix mucor TaxID=45248 RepID=A0A7V2T4N0_LEUMU|nr:DUF4124 domain-containing protein [Leucothrix mucor]